MGWRQRDWARFNDDERRAFFGSSGALPPSAEGATHRTEQTYKPPKRRRRRWMLRARRRLNQVGAFLLVCLGVAGAFAYIVNHRPSEKSGPTYVFGQSGLPLKTAAPTNTIVVRPPPNVISIRWRPRDLARATSAGRICVTTHEHGRICASYVVGESPADNLTRRIDSLGLQVQSQG